MNNQRAAKLVNLLSLGDGKPSELMNSMSGLVAEELARTGLLTNDLLVQRMPPDIRAHLVKIQLNDCYHLEMKRWTVFAL